MGEHSVIVERLVKIYGGSVRALNGISFKVDRGSIYCLAGPNGAGKSTTFRILSTLILPTSGDAYIEGLHVVREAGRVRGIISYLPEEAGAYKNITGFEYLSMVSKIYFRGREADEALERGIRISGLSEKDLGRPMKQYSKGMKRRIQVARALMIVPRVAILDEPTAGLDPAQKAEIRGIIKSYPKNYGVTVLLSTHEMSEAESLCERVAIIDKGYIVAEGSVDEIISSQGARNLEEAFLKLISR
ncbi:MAG TPA: ABC transporter ATP-binding protein [Sulfolobales archaeon]|nr:ABC transporter ATP-binding protein [Sulfolobales archaeon]